ncbi:unnamed protein product [Urochloa humidicola]
MGFGFRVKPNPNQFVRRPITAKVSRKPSAGGHGGDGGGCSIPRRRLPINGADGDSSYLNKWALPRLDNRRNCS